MDDIDQLLADGDELFSRVQLAAPTAWEAEKDNIPEDAYDEEESEQPADYAEDGLDDDEEDDGEGEDEDEPLTSKLANIAAIQDDAIFSKELRDLTDTL
jgi:hypothetical protein